MRNYMQRIICVCIIVALTMSSGFCPEFVSNAANQEVTDIEKIQVRDDKLLLYPTVHDYSTVTGSNVSATVAKVADYNMLDYIYVYTSTDNNATGVSLRDIYVSGKIRYRVYGEANSLGISMNNYSYENVVKVVIKEGCELPSFEYTNNGSVQKKAFIMNEDVTYIASNIDYAGNGLTTVWERQANEPPKEEEDTLVITGPVGEVVPYKSAVKNYLDAIDGNVTQYHVQMDNQAQDVRITWSANYNAEIKEFWVEYATKSDFSDAIKIITDSDKREIAVQNLYKGTKYYVKVTVVFESGAKSFAESTFSTTAIGPRFMTIDGIYNVRDLGGYVSEYGGTTKQGMIYRGGALCPTTAYQHVQITEDGKNYMSNVLGIKMELDFRDATEAGGHTTSYIPGATLQYTTIDGYASAFKSNYQNAYREVFQTLAKEENYPMYIHCTGGADRTGTVSFLLNALLGVSEKELVQDYECTSFSLYGIRDSQTGIYASYYKAFREKLDEYNGMNLAEKTENYLLSIGVTRGEINSIRKIMGVNAPERYGTEVTSLALMNNCLVFTLSQTDFEGAVNDASASSYKDYNYWNKIQVYLSGQSTSVTLEYANADGDYAAGENPQKGNTFYNLWTNPNTFAVGSSLRINSTAEKVVIPAGTEFPSYQYTSGNITTKKSFVTTEEVIYIQDGGNWVKYEPPKAIDTSVTSISVMNDCFVFTLSETDFSGAVNDTSASTFTDYSFWNNVQVYVSGQDSPITLATANADTSTSNPQKGNTFYNLWTNENTFAVGSATGIHSNAVKIVIPAGTEFPSYRYTSGKIAVRNSFVTTEEIAFVKDGGSWVEYVAPSALDTSVTSISVMNDCFVFTLSETDFSGAVNDTSASTFTDYSFWNDVQVYVSGQDSPITLAAANGDTSTSNPQKGNTFYNLWTNENTFAVGSATGIHSNAVKIVIPAGTEFPSYRYTSGKIAVRNSFVTTEEISFVKNGSVWIEYIPTEERETVVNALHVRSDSGKLIFFLSENDYANVAGTTLIGSRFQECNLFQNVIIYKSETEYKSLAEIYGNEEYYNIWGENGCIGVDLKDGWDGTNIQKVVILAGCEFPVYEYTSGATNVKTMYKTKYDIVFTATEQTVDNISYVQSIILPANPIETEVEDVKIMGAPEDVRLIFTLSVQDYVATLDSVPCSVRFQDYNTLENVFLCAGNERIALKDVVNEDEIYYNLWGNTGSISYGLKSEYGVYSFEKIIVSSGCQFPAYAYTSTDSLDKVAYTTISEKEIALTPSTFKVNYYDENKNLLYVDEIVCGTPLVLRPVPTVEGYIGSWDGMNYTLMPAKDISYDLSYEKVENVTEDTTDDESKDESNVDKKEEQQSEKTSPVTGDWNVKLVFWSIVCMIITGVVIVFIIRKKLQFVMLA